MTSRDLTENVEQLQVRQSLERGPRPRGRDPGRLARLAASTNRPWWPAARTTSPPRRPRSASGSRPSPTSCWSRSSGLEELLARYPLRGIKGPMGTSQDMLDLLDGDETRLAELERRVAAHLGFERVLDSVGQVYPRSLDFDVVSALVQLVAAPSNLATTIRLMAGHELVTEGFAEGQVGSSRCPTR
jgi:adenylosuccinate lyase